MSIWKEDPYPPVKITFIGDASVGKSSLVQRLARDRFPENTNSTIGAAFVAMRFAHGTNKARVYHIWDTAGQERFNSLIPLYLSGASVIVAVYDITSPYTFERIREHWLPYVRDNLRLKQGEPMPMIYLLGNKKDLASEKRCVTTREAQILASEHNMGFLEVSAKTGEGAEEVFRNIARHADDLVIRQADAIRLSRVEENVGGVEISRSCCAGYVSNWGTS